MANEFRIAVGVTGLDLYGVLSPVGAATVIRVTTGLPATEVDGDWEGYAVPFTELNSSGVYTASMPTVCLEGAYDIAVYDQPIPTPAMTDELVGASAVPVMWSGTAIVIVPEITTDLWRRFFKKAASDTTLGTIKTYEDDGTTVRTTQTVTVAGTVTTVGAAT